MTDVWLYDENGDEIPGSRLSLEEWAKYPGWEHPPPCVFHGYAYETDGHVTRVPQVARALEEDDVLRLVDA